jgi:hypothetical protein
MGAADTICQRQFADEGKAASRALCKNSLSQKRERVAHTRMYEPPSQELRQVRANACRISEPTIKQLLCRLVKRRDFLKFLGQRLGISQPTCGPLNQLVISPHTSVANRCSEIHHKVMCGVLEYGKTAGNVTADQHFLDSTRQDPRKCWCCGQNSTIEGELGVWVASPLVHRDNFLKERDSITGPS